MDVTGIRLSVNGGPMLAPMDSLVPTVSGMFRTAQVPSVQWRCLGRTRTRRFVAMGSLSRKVSRAKVCANVDVMTKTLFDAAPKPLSLAPRKLAVAAKHLRPTTRFPANGFWLPA